MCTMAEHAQQFLPQYNGQRNYNISKNSLKKRSSTCGWRSKNHKYPIKCITYSYENELPLRECQVFSGY